jgi:hypothetical protein
MRRLMAAIGELVDMRDLLLLAGLGLVGFGLWDVYRPASFAVPGAVLTGVAVFGVRR